MNAITTERRIAIVSPFYNEGENVRPFIARLTRALSDARIDWQLICVNDGSSDDTLARLIAARAAEPRIAIIDLSRNFGKEYAITAGLDFADASAVILMDADLQHPPEMIPQMIAKWLEGYEVVYMARRRRSDIGVVKRAARRLFYFAFRTVSQVSLPPDAGDFRLLDASVVAAIREMPEQTRFMKGIYHWVGFRQIGLPYDEEPRARGVSKYRPFRLVGFAFDGLTAFSNAPLKLWSALGAAIASASVLYAAYRIVRTLLYGVDVPGYESLMVAISFLGGLQLLSLGVLGSYIGRIFDEVKGRPLYIVRRIYRAGEPAPAAVELRERDEAYPPAR